MTTERKINKLEQEGWNVVFNNDEYVYYAQRGFVKYKCKTITGLYKSIKNDFKYG